MMAELLERGDLLCLALLLGAALAVVGLWQRAAARRRLDRLERARRVRRRPGSVGAGPCTVEGVWQRLDEHRGLVDGGADGALVVVGEAALPAIADGARVLVVGFAGGQEEDPRGAVGYRSGGPLPRVLVSGAGSFVSDDVGRLERGAARARLWALAGGLGFALGGALAGTALLALLRRYD